MDHFEYRDDELYAEACRVSDLIVQFGSPCYIYSRATLERHWHAFNNALGNHPHQICYAVKANSNLAVLNVLAKLGSGFDIVSGGELARVLAAKGDPRRVIFSGVGKSCEEIDSALDYGIHCFNVESIPELQRINARAGQKNLVAPIAFRLNPNVDAKTHPYIATGLEQNKFGIPIYKLDELCQQLTQLPHVKLIGLDCHIGSQLLDLQPMIEALDQLIDCADRLLAQGFALEHLDVGGGLGVCYQNEKTVSPKEYARALLKRIKHRPFELILEPGRAIAANAGILVTQVEYIKRTQHRQFAIVDAAMNDLIRPALYQAWQRVIPVRQRHDIESAEYDLVGPVCETGDFLAKQRMLAIKQGDYLAIRGCGAYGFTMSSNYNSRPRVAEVLVDGEHAHLVRQRECYDDLFVGESLVN